MNVVLVRQELLRLTRNEKKKKVRGMFNFYNSERNFHLNKNK